MSERIRKLEDFVRNLATRAPESHDLSHFLEVKEIATELALRERGVNLDVLQAAALLHDINRSNEKYHAIRSAEEAKIILPQFGFSAEEIKEICHAIRAHSRSSLREEPRTLEAKILYDADKLAGVGPSGVKRAIAYGKERGWSEWRTAHWYFQRIKDVIENEPFYTKEAYPLLELRLKPALAFCEPYVGKEAVESLLKKIEVLKESVGKK